MTDVSRERRKALVDAYRRTPKQMGVYAITNTRNGKRYVAASRDVRARINRHKMDLKTGSDRVAALQADWSRFGADVFQFDMLERLEPLEDPGYDPAEDLQVLEQIWLEKLQPYGDRGYNNR